MISLEVSGCRHCSSWAKVRENGTSILQLKVKVWGMTGCKLLLKLDGAVITIGPNLPIPPLREDGLEAVLHSTEACHIRRKGPRPK